MGLGIDACTFGTEATYQQFQCGHEAGYTYPFYDKPTVVLHIQFWVSLVVVEHKFPTELNTLYLKIAITLCHELAHLVWKYRIQMELPPWSPHKAFAEPLHTKDERVAELGLSWELHVFGGKLSTIDWPGTSITIYLYGSNLGNSPSRQIAVIVPNWWINIWSSTHTWHNFAKFRATGQLRLPTEAESGYALHNRALGNTTVWSLYHEGRPILHHCRRPDQSTRCFWVVMRPFIQKLSAQYEARTAALALDSDETGGKPRQPLSCAMLFASNFHGLFVAPDFVDHLSPDSLRQKVAGANLCRYPCPQLRLQQNQQNAPPVQPEDEMLDSHVP
ncbi:hypothetical protein ACJQWK_03250 [Exserohilum turcicum]